MAEEKSLIKRRARRQYHCDWCGHDFTAYPGDAVSTNQIKCPNCTRFIPTYKKVDLGNGKHMHV